MTTISNGSMSAPDTFYCERCDDEKPIAGRVDVNDGWSTPDWWCFDCYDNYDPTPWED
jgi:hypothetical protein